MLSLKSDSSSGDISHSSRKGMKIAQNLLNKRGAQCAWSSTRMTTGSSTDLCGTIGKSYGHATSMNMLPEDVFFEIFDLYRKSVSNISGTWNWHVLVRVCQRWRRIIFSYPRCLDVHLSCSRGAPVRRRLGRWPACLLAIDYATYGTVSPYDQDGIYAALEHPNRVCRVALSLPSPLLAKMTTAMQKPFPALTCHWLVSDRGAPLLPDGFLGGSAPCLQQICFEAIPFPELPMFLLSAHNLTHLHVFT